MRREMNITIVGAGNIGTQFAVHCAEKGHRVTLFGSKPEKIQHELTIVDEADRVIHRGTIAGATSDAGEAFAQADLIFVAMPATLMQTNAARILPYARPGMKICLVPGTGGGECAFKACADRGATLFGLQRVPSVARLVEYGAVVRASGYRGELFAAAIPATHTEECCRIIASLFDIPTTPMPNYLNITLTPSNPILHTTRLRTLYRDYRPGVVYPRVPLFYEEWTDDSSALLLACDGEVQQICAALPQFDLTGVRSLRLHYESDTVPAMTKKLSGIASLKGLASPAVAVPGGYIPDFSSRYFTADFSFGLTILVQIAAFLGVPAPHMQETLRWYHGLVPEGREFRFADYGIHTLDDFLEFYAR